MWSDMSYNKYKDRCNEIEFENIADYNIDEYEYEDSEDVLNLTNTYYYGLYEDIETLENC